MVQPQAVVIDTNVVLDLWFFDDPHVQVLQQLLQDQALVWWATRPMQEELNRVLQYPHLLQKAQEKSASLGVPPGALLERVQAAFDRGVRWGEPAERAPYVCKDVDDQKFIDLAVEHQALLVSKDKAVLSMAKRLMRLSVWVGRPQDMASLNL